MHCQLASLPADPYRTNLSEYPGSESEDDTNEADDPAAPMTTSSQTSTTRLTTPSGTPHAAVAPEFKGDANKAHDPAVVVLSPGPSHGIDSGQGKGSTVDKRDGTSIAKGQLPSLPVNMW